MAVTCEKAVFPNSIRPSSAARFAAALAAAVLVAACGGSDSPAPPGLYVSTTTLATAEGGEEVPFGVQLGTAPTSDVYVSVCTSESTEGGLMETGDVYASSCLVLVFDATNWSTPQQIRVVPYQDTLRDGNQTYTITVSVVGTADAAYAAVPPRTITVTNADDEIPAVTISKTTASTSEALTSDTFTVRLNTAPATTVTIPVTSTDATEGLLRGGSSPATSAPIIDLTFTTANWSTPQTVTILGQDDAVDDGNQTYSLTVGPPTGDPDYAALLQQTVAVTNVDDDTAGITVTASPTPLVTSENGTTATFTVRLNTQPTVDVAVLVTSGNAAEGLLSAGAENLVGVVHLNFTVANWNSPQTVTVTGQDEVATQVPSDNVTYDVTVGPATGDAAHAALPVQTVQVLNSDNDTAAVIVPAAAGLQTAETGAGNIATFTVGINREPTSNVVIPITVSDVSEGLVRGGSSPSVSVATLDLTFTPADFQTSQTVSVVGQVDNVVDGNQVYLVTIGAPTGDAVYASLPAQVLSVTNADTDVAGFTLSKTTLSTTEGGAPASFTVVLNRAPVADVVVPVASSNAAEGRVAGGDSGGSFIASLQLTFTPASWQTPQTVQVQGQPDSIDDGDRAYAITVGPTSSASAPYDGIAARSISATNVDVDVAGFTITPISGLVTTETGGTTTFTVQLDSIPTGTVTIPVTVNDSSETTVSAGGAPTNYLTLLFTASDWSTPQTVTVHGVDDFVADGTVSWTISVGSSTSGDPKYQALAAKSVFGATRDDDATNQGSAVTPIDVSGLLPFASQVGSGASYYRLDGLAPGAVTLTLTGVLGDVSLRVYSSPDFTSGLLCSSTNAGETATESCTATVPASGTVYVLVSASNGTTGALYSIALGPPTESEPNGTIGTANGPYGGDVITSGALPSSDYDYYAIRNTGASAASVTMETFTGSVGSCSYDTVLDLYTAAGTFLAGDDDGGVNFCSSLTYSIPAGQTYYLRVRAFGGSPIPGYLLRLDFP